jgi:hypothetical protein
MAIEDEEQKRQRIDVEGSGWDLDEAYTNYMLLSEDQIK